MSMLMSGSTIAVAKILFAKFVVPRFSHFLVCTKSGDNGRTSSDCDVVLSYYKSIVIFSLLFEVRNCSSLLVTHQSVGLSQVATVLISPLIAIIWLDERSAAHIASNFSFRMCCQLPEVLHPLGLKAFQLA